MRRMPRRARRGVLQQVREKGALRCLHRLDNRRQQALARAEVVDEHAVAGANGGGGVAQTEVADAVALDVLDHRERAESTTVALDTCRSDQLSKDSFDTFSRPLYHVVHVPYGTDLTEEHRSHGPFTFSADAWSGGRPTVVYHCLADYRAHHRVDGGFLPPAFTSLEVSRAVSAPAPSCVSPTRSAAAASPVLSASAQPEARPRARRKRQR